MFEPFTDRARKIMHLAEQDARRRKHAYIGTEHLLLGLLKEGSGVAAQLLQNQGIDAETVRLEVDRILQSGPDKCTMRRLPRTPRAKKVVEYSTEEAGALKQNYIDSEHILLGLLRENEGVAAQVLFKLGLKLERVRSDVQSLVDARVLQPSAATPP